MVFRVVEPVESRELPVRVVLFASLFKFDRFEWMVEKATELGVAAIVPVAPNAVTKGCSRPRASVWSAGAGSRGRAASKRGARACRRFAEPQRLECAVAGVEGFRYRLEEEPGAAPLAAALPRNRAAEAEAALLVGPEGGWTDAERTSLAEWLPVSLGPQILRSETAALAALAVMTSTWWAAAASYNEA